MSVDPKRRVQVVSEDAQLINEFFNMLVRCGKTLEAVRDFIDGMAECPDEIEDDEMAVARFAGPHLERFITRLFQQYPLGTGGARIDADVDTLRAVAHGSTKTKGPLLTGQDITGGR